MPWRCRVSSATGLTVPAGYCRPRRRERGRPALAAEVVEQRLAENRAGELPVHSTSTWIGRVGFCPDVILQAALSEGESVQVPSPAAGAQSRPLQQLSPRNRAGDAGAKSGDANG